MIVSKSDSTLIKVSICVVTYNQEEFIGNCLDSLVGQFFGGGCEILVSDDASTDRTQEIIKDYSEKYPDLIFPVFQEKNVGAFKNYASIHRRARGEYVCHMDGDDYALPMKTKRQIEFLDVNHDFSAVVHRMKVLKGAEESITKINPGRIDMEYLLLNHPSFLHSSLMYRRSFAQAFLSCSEDFIDFYAYVCLAGCGSIGFISDVLGVYRAEVGISRSLRLMPLIQMAIDKAALLGCDCELVKRARSKQYLSYAVASLIKKEYSAFKEYIASAHRFYPRGFIILFLYWFSWMPNTLRVVVRLVKML